MTGVNDRVRDAYRLLVYTHPTGMTRIDLALALKLEDRPTRKTVEELKPLAARHPHPDLGALIIGFDPELQVYTYAKDPEQARRIIAFETSYVRAQLAGILAQVDAFKETYGVEPTGDGVTQEDLFGARRVMTFNFARTG